MELKESSEAILESANYCEYKKHGVALSTIAIDFYTINQLS